MTLRSRIDRRVSIQLVSPARGELETVEHYANTREVVMFPFNWFPLREGSWILEVSAAFLPPDPVSIQLVSPARGERDTKSIVSNASEGFHSIGFPCERGVA